MNLQRNRHGFTIVELLIVIVVIGILAAITVVAYNGVRSRANASLVQSELTNSAHVIEADKAVTGSYPTYPSSLNDGKGLPIGNMTSFQYHATATTYCVTATNGTATYTISNASSTPTPGACAGDPTSGNIANVATNPGLEVNTTGWGSTWVATPVARVTTGSGIVTGSAAFEISAGTANASGGQYNHSNLQANTAYTVSAYVTLISGDGNPFMISANDGAGTRAWKSITASLVAGQPVRVNLTWTSSATPNGNISFMRNGASAGTAVIRIDNLMITQGSTLNNYADGSSTGWTWSGAANNSTSTGPAL
jgi:general secretion pathway protein G